MISIEYAAGFIDGEGCIRCYVRQPRPGKGVSPSHRVIVTTSNTHRGVLEQMQERWSGSIHYQRTPENGRPLWVWNVNGHATKALLEDLLPYLIIKKDQAETALKLISTMRNRGRARLTDEEIAYREGLRLELVAQKKTIDDGNVA